MSFYFSADIPVGREETKEKRNFKLPHLHWCHWFIKGWGEFCWKAEVQCTSRISDSFKSSKGKMWKCSSFFDILSRSNLMGTKFTVFDNALNPERALPDMSNARQELAGIIYVSHDTAHEYCFRVYVYIYVWILISLIFGTRKQTSWGWRGPEGCQLSFQEWTRTTSECLSDREM